LEQPRDGVVGIGRDRLDLEAALELDREVAARPGPVVVDLARATSFTGAGAAALIHLLRERGTEVRFRGASEDLKRYLRELPLSEIVAADCLGCGIEEEPLLATAGGGFFELVAAARYFVALGLELAYWTVLAPFRGVKLRFGKLVTELNRIGVDAIPIVGLIAALMGVILALNSAGQLRAYGAEKYTANLVGIALTRELAPVITAILVAGRSGSAIAAEIGTMVVSEEIDALRTMGLSPVRFLVVPKILALVLMLPLLVVLSNAAGIFGGYVVGILTLGLSSTAYLTQTVQALQISDVVTGLVKSVVFALLIGFVGVYRGLSVHGGSESVGRATTSAVVTAIILCIIANAFFTAFFYVTG